jgi:hypothetical protein
LLDRVAHKIVGAPTIDSEHDGKGAQMGNARDDSDRVRAPGPQVAAIVIAFSITYRYDDRSAAPVRRRFERHSFYRA